MSELQLEVEKCAGVNGDFILYTELVSDGIILKTLKPDSLYPINMIRLMRVHSNYQAILKFLEFPRFLFINTLLRSEGPKILIHKNLRELCHHLTLDHLSNKNIACLTYVVVSKYVQTSERLPKI